MGGRAGEAGETGTASEVPRAAGVARLCLRSRDASHILSWSDMKSPFNLALRG